MLAFVLSSMTSASAECYHCCDIPESLLYSSPFCSTRSYQVPPSQRLLQRSLAFPELNQPNPELQQ